MLNIIQNKIGNSFCCSIQTKVKITLLYISIIIIAGVIISFPSIVFGFPDGGHDSIFHLTWFKLFSEQLWAGEFYPRWLINENGGLGGPVFFYTPPLSYYVTSILSPFFKNDPFGWQQLGISAVLGLIASGITAFLWVRSITNDKTAVISAIFYMNMPYHVTIDLYERAAFNEFWAFVWMPLILYFFNNIRKGQKSAILGMAVSYALLIMTHIPTALIFSIIPIAYLFININPSSHRNAIFSTVVAMILGISLSAIYLIPALSTQGYVHLEDPGNWSRYMRHFMFTQLIPSWIFMLELTLIVVGMMVLVSCAVFIYLSNSGVKLKQEFLFWVVIGIMSIFMMTPLSRPVVEIFPIISRIQFPWRFNTMLVLAATPIVGISIFSLRKPYTRPIIMALTISALLVTSWLGINIWQGIQETTREDRKLFNEKILAGSFEGPTRPRWAPGNLQEIAANVDRINIERGVGKIEITRWKPRDIKFSVNSIDGLALSVGQLYYPGWTAHITGEPCCLWVQPCESTGLITFYVPGGDHEISLRLLTSTQEFIGQMISASSLIIIILLAIWLSVSNYRKSLN
jgi:hypothetical protein